MALHLLLNQTPSHQLYCGVHKEMQEKQPTGGERALKGYGPCITLKTSGLRRPQTQPYCGMPEANSYRDESLLFGRKIMVLAKKKMFVFLQVHASFKRWAHERMLRLPVLSGTCLSWGVLYCAACYVSEKTHGTALVTHAVGGSAFCKYVLLAHILSLRYSPFLRLWRNSRLWVSCTTSSFRSSFGPLLRDLSLRAE